MTFQNVLDCGPAKIRIFRYILQTEHDVLIIYAYQHSILLPKDSSHRHNHYEILKSRHYFNHSIQQI